MGSQPPEAARSSFDKIRKDRNRAVHFFHGELAKKKIAVEQSFAWYHLNKLLTVQWADLFKGYEERIARIEWKLRRQRGYLQFVFADLKQDIAERIPHGSEIIRCTVCHFKSAESNEVLRNVFKHHCLVCLWSRDLFDLLDAAMNEKSARLDQYMGDALRDVTTSS